MQQSWSEVWVGGSPEAERLEFDSLAVDIMRVQLKNQRTASAHGVPHPVDRAFHVKPTLAVEDAVLTFTDLPEDLRAEFATPNASYQTTVRFSNAAAVAGRDSLPDLRGVALRVQVAEGTSHDLLMTNFPVSHARDARQFVAFAKATAGGRIARLVGLTRLGLMLGPREVLRMLRNIAEGRRHRPASVATETYWSRGAIRWGPALAVRYLLRPAPDTRPAPHASTTDQDHLAHEVAQRLAAGDVRLELCIQRYVDARSTPIEDTSVEWRESVSPAEPVALLTIGRRDVTSTDAMSVARRIETLAFNPWNTTDSFRPLGNLNRARKAVYDASSAHRLGLRWHADPPVHNVLIGGAVDAVFGLLNRFVDWWRLPYRLGLLNLDALRHQLRAHNLIDTDPHEAPPAARPVPPSPSEQGRVERTFDGTSNDLSAPAMGAVGAPFGRNLTPQFRPELFDEPNPILVSRALLYRNDFVAARTLNILAAAWIQFQVHDWVNHARHPLGGVHDVRVPLPPGMTWTSTADGPPENVMRIAGNRSFDAADGADLDRLFGDAATHWWDGSEVYGADSEMARQLREGPKIRLTSKGYLPDDKSGQEMTGFNESWWLGLSSMHTLFAREHNVVCDELRSHYPGWSDDRVYQTARLIVSALIAKIHTVEWTPAILGTKAIDIGLHANWSGPPANDWLTKLGSWLVDTHSSVGIPKTKPDHHGAPYCLTEDFATVYRMHPLIPDEYLFASHRTGEMIERKGFLDIVGIKTDPILRSMGLEDVLYSFGIAHPGAITLHNYPRTLQAFIRDGERIDLSVVDLVRTRRRGIPRYNDFRVGLHKPRITRWEDLCANPDSVQALREVYRSIDDVDTMIGLFAETPPPGFGFSDTAFRIFILMASRRLQSDRFLTVDFRPEIYSPFGMDWIANNGMTSVILRHCPDLVGVLPRELSAFAPWRPVGPTTPAPTNAPDSEVMTR
jgi:hypothetical protein